MRRFYEPAQNLVNESNLHAAANRLSVGFRLSRNLIGVALTNDPLYHQRQPLQSLRLDCTNLVCRVVPTRLLSATLRLRKLNRYISKRLGPDGAMVCCHFVLKDNKAGRLYWLKLFTEYECGTES